MSSVFTDHGVIIALGCAMCAVLYGVVTTQRLLALSPGNETMQRISGAVQEGARAYLNRQYSTIAVVGVVLFVALIFVQNIRVAIGFGIGGVLSGAAGYIGMNVSVRANARVAESARGGVSPALNVAFRGGAITGLLVVGLALVGVAGYYGVLTWIFGESPKSTVDALVGLGFGGSLISVFARLGGGIFTKAADVGADLVGKVEAGIPEDDPRNPAVIADNVGDNVGDCAGMAADLFETYAVTDVAVMLLGVLTFNQPTAVALYPLVLGGAAILASIIGTFAVRTRTGNVERALYQGLIVSGLIAAGLFYPVTHWLMDGVTFKAGGGHIPQGRLYLCALIGIGVTACLFLLTDYYTSTRFAPVKKTAAASQTGHATNIISGLAQGLQATALPALVLVLGILGSWKLAGGGVHGIYGIGVAVMGQLSLTGLIVALDAFGPITDNAGGIAEMADLPEEVRNVTDPLDAVGNTTKAVTKGYAIGSAVLAAIVLFAGFQQELHDKGHVATGGDFFSIANPAVLMGLLLGGLMVCLFAALSMEAVGRAGGGVVEEVRRQFREKPGIMDYTERPDYGPVIDICTSASLRELATPALLAVLTPVIIGFGIGYI
ncbi:MAG TPA: sodium-translocating pyrophosphatase, partial [Solirubrobacteraceae bacterium]|nr:sodium-translocating pyrophosphatase [Solirubrobacteraceae bacterium]